MLGSTRTAYEENLERVRGESADVIANNKWMHISLGDAPGAFSVQQPTGAISNLVVNELGLAYGPKRSDQFHRRRIRVLSDGAVGRHVFGLPSSVTDFVTASGWLNRVKTKAFATL
ncbi:hypothetical protein R3Q06_23780 [Rhodococcus erythropolis]|uniref:hypothetical protein n=1 Tax=Rhodococcus erythropolis TaxID=1833 RepID=UPI00294A4153|nr:hypothetical protein [Rhodococcus erythropolis]MDV6276524.1 hypothetical protein [Rhodococcus erythropolis]